ncbi:sigma-70 region 4 domain-containing protein [Escherichia coli]|uniref:sigma-70 region 4 domain-containing protein n=1 Tax=Escherichia coli TaxID=562 RepID=UPI00193B307F|nr:sigma-70 region 4 domain-containing protein [Escherichia coli]MBM2973655.1 sigma-70 region 4 domain-containing protein [Escherichia coli]
MTLEERRAVLNRYYRGLSIAEITEETGQNDKTVYGHLRRALQLDLPLYFQTPVIT